MYYGRTGANEIKAKINLNNISKSSSINVDKFIQSKNSNEDEIEEKFSYDESSKRYQAGNNKGDSIEEDSTLRKVENSGGKKKDSSKRDNSDIKEEVIKSLIRLHLRFMMKHLSLKTMIKLLESKQLITYHPDFIVIILIYLTD